MLSLVAIGIVVYQGMACTVSRGSTLVSFASNSYLVQTLTVVTFQHLSAFPFEVLVQLKIQ